MRAFAIASLCLGAGLPLAACAQGSNDGSEEASRLQVGSQPGQVSGSVDSGAAVLDQSTGAADPPGVASAISEAGAPGVDGGGAEAGPTTAEREAAVGSPADGSTAATEAGVAPAPAEEASVAASGDDAQAAGGPAIGGCSVFPADNPWNTRIDDPTAYPVHPNSATYITNMSPSTHLHADWGDWSVDHFGIPWQTVGGGQALVPMTFSEASESDPGPYPFPADALVEGGSGSGGDMHVLVLDTGTCTLYETWDSSFVGPGWSCGSGAVFNLASNALRPDGWTSADAAGLPILPGLVKLSEVQAGAIPHALRFTVNSTQQGYIHPATHAAGTDDASLPPMGLRVRLKASFDLSGFSGPALVILTAMQQYGLLLADNGSNWFVTGDSNDGWTPLMDGITSAFAQVDGSDFEAVSTGPISTAGL